MKNKRLFNMFFLVLIIGICIIAIKNFSIQDNKGSLEMFSVGVLLLITGFIQFKFHVFLFKLQHFMWVKDPEPTDAYIAFSKIGGFILCVFGIVSMIYGAGIF